MVVEVTKPQTVCWLTRSSLFSMNSSSMLTASILTPMYSVEPCCTFGINSTSKQYRGKFPNKLTVWLRKKRKEFSSLVMWKISNWVKKPVVYSSYPWNSSVCSSPSARLSRQCLSMAPKCLYSAAPSFMTDGRYMHGLGEKIIHKNLTLECRNNIWVWLQVPMIK